MYLDCGVCLLEQHVHLHWLLVKTKLIATVGYETSGHFRVS